MKKIIKFLLIILLIAGVGFAGYYFYTTNNKDIEVYKTETAYITTIESETVATGKVVPEDEVEIVPQLSGILHKLYVEEGDIINTGDLLAKIKVVPNEAALNSARGRLRNTELVLKNAELEYERNKTLFDKGIIASQAFNNAELSYSQAKQSLRNAQSDLRIIKEGTAGGGTTNTKIRATVSGTILEIPVEAGDQVIESNTFNPGTTIATIADLTKMIFEGKIDEADVSKLVIGMPLTVSLAAIRDKEFEAKLKFVAPKGTEESGTVQFTIKAEVFLTKDVFVRAGYSANAAMILDRKKDVLAINETLLQFDEETEEPYVEVETEDQVFERRDLKLGLSDGIKVQIDSGVTINDKIKVWNKTEPLKKKSDYENG
jgi:HlyD family secretion protein